MNKDKPIFRKKLSVLPEGEKVNVLDDKSKNNILGIRTERIDLNPGMAGVDPYSLDQLMEEGSNLVSLDIVITCGCNFKCVWCYRPGGEWGKMFLSFDKIKELIDDALKLKVKYFVITGGEPLMYRDGDKTYFDVIDYINEVYSNSTLECHILTFSDVALITPIIAQKFANRRVALCLKRDSINNRIQDAVLGVEDGAAKMVNGYQNLFESGYGSDNGPAVTVNTVLARNIPAKNGTVVNTTSGLIDLHVWVRKMNMEHSVVPIHYCGEALKEEQEGGINPLDIKVLYDIMSAIDEIEFNDIWQVLAPFPKNKTCNRPGRGLHIRGTGDVTSCSESPPIDDYTFGNISSDKLLDVVLSDKFRNFRKAFDSREGKYICNSKACDLYANKLCRGGCATRSAYSKVNVETGCIERNTVMQAYVDGREDPLCPAWIILARKQGALVEGIYEEYVDYYLSNCSLSSLLKGKIRDKIISEFYER